MNDLFATAQVAATAAPLAERLRPKVIADVIGQRHLLAPGKPIAVAFSSGKMHSMILWGPPGVGKTTLARLMADALQCGVHRDFGRAGGRQGDSRSGGARRSGAGAIRPSDDPFRRRGAPLQQGATGCVPAVRRTRDPDLHRCDHRESFVRGQQRVAVARHRLRAGAALGGRPCRAARPRRRGGDARRRVRRARARRLDRLRRRRRPAPHQPGRATRRGGEGGGAQFGRHLVPRSHHHAQPAPLRQGRRSVLRPDFRASQIGARLGSRCVAVLDVPDARWRGRPALRRAPAHQDGKRGHRTRGPARAAAGARRGRNLRTPRLAGRRTRARAMRVCISPPRPSRMPPTSPSTLRGRSSPKMVRGPCRCGCATRRPN